MAVDVRTTAAFRRHPGVVGWRIGRAAVDDDRSCRDLSCDTHAALDRWVRRMLGSAEHERRVTEISTDLFDVTASLHRLDANDLRLLRWASMVHDVGRAICDDTHPHQGAKLLKAERALPLSPTQRRHLAYLTLYHRGNVPDVGRDDVLCGSDDCDRLYRVLALLRAADGLDNRALAGRQHEPPRVVFGLTHRPTRPSTLHVACYLSNDCAKARRVYRKRKKFRLLEQVLECDVVPAVIADRATRWVA